VLALNDIHGNVELDAMLAAHIVKIIAMQPQDTIWVGDVAEGLIAIPPGKPH